MSSSDRERFERLTRQLQLSITAMEETPTSLLGFGLRGATPVVLKVIRHTGDEWWSGHVLRAFDGHGMVRALDVFEGAVLLERLVPATTLATLSLSGRDAEATAILTDVVHRLMAPRVPPGLPTVADWGRTFARYLATNSQQVGRALVERAQAWFGALAGSQAAVRLLHGDLQHYNVLFDAERGWVAIDPKGVLGEVAFEFGAALRNPVERLREFSSPRVIERRLARLGAAGIPVALDRVMGWAYAQAVLSALWMIEDGMAVAPDAPTIQLAGVLEAMLPRHP